MESLVQSSHALDGLFSTSPLHLHHARLAATTRPATGPLLAATPTRASAHDLTDSAIMTSTATTVAATATILPIVPPPWKPAWLLQVQQQHLPPSHAPHEQQRQPTTASASIDNLVMVGRAGSATSKGGAALAAALPRGLPASARPEGDAPPPAADSGRLATPFQHPVAPRPFMLPPEGSAGGADALRDSSSFSLLSAPLSPIALSSDAAAASPPLLRGACPTSPLAGPAEPGERSCPCSVVAPRPEPDEEFDCGEELQDDVLVAQLTLGGRCPPPWCLGPAVGAAAEQAWSRHFLPFSRDVAYLIMCVPSAFNASSQAGAARPSLDGGNSTWDKQVRARDLASVWAPRRGRSPTVGRV